MQLTRVERVAQRQRPFARSDKGNKEKDEGWWRATERIGNSRGTVHALLLLAGFWTGREATFCLFSAPSLADAADARAGGRQRGAKQRECFAVA